jgi:capsule polysaccharide export protein KpsE/RkpR
MIDAFDLVRVYGKEARFEARDKLSANVRVAAGRKDGLISVEVDDHDPKRAAAMANRMVEELGRMTNGLALTEAQQRRAFFERQLTQTRDRLAQAQVALQSSGYSAGALKAEPRAAAERYARLNAEVTAAEVRLQTLRSAMSDTTPEVQHQQALWNALRSQLARAEAPVRNATESADYVGKYREFKYQETLFELFARQFELARLDESREGGLIQVVDPAIEPEHKSRPKRGLIAALAALGALFAAAAWCVARAAFAAAASRARTRGQP